MCIHSILKRNSNTFGIWNTKHKRNLSIEIWYVLCFVFTCLDAIFLMDGKFIDQIFTNWLQTFFIFWLSVVLSFEIFKQSGCCEKNFFFSLFFSFSIDTDMSINFLHVKSQLLVVLSFNICWGFGSLFFFWVA